jgi:hypothetical protein
MSAVRNRGLVIWILVLTLCASATPQQKMLWQGVVKLGAVNVYQNASTSERVTTTLKQGDVVDVVLEINIMGDAWCRISRAGTSEPVGFVLCFNLEQNHAPKQISHSESVATQSPPHAAPTAAPQKLSQATDFNSGVMSNKDILDMNKMGLPPQILVAKIKSSQCNFDTSPASLQALKMAGVGDNVILAMVEAPVGQPKPSGVSDPPDVANASNTPSPTTTAPAQPMAQNPSAMDRQLPRVFLQSASHGNTWNARRDQSMEMSKDFQKVCPGVRVTLNQQMADYTVLLNHIELGLFARDNQMEIADRNGDLLQTKEGGSIKGSVKKVCDLILANWAKQ